MRGKGGGPKSANGKAAVRKNAVKHGLRSESTDPVVLNVESADEWKAHLNGMVESLSPQGYHEEELAVRIAEILWRLRRVARYEAEHIRRTVDRIPNRLSIGAEYALKVTGTPIEESITPERVDMAVGNSLIPDIDGVTQITRYEAHLHRIYIQTLHELEAMQRGRRGELVPLARLDISGPPG